MKEVSYYAIDTGSQTLREFLEHDLSGKYDEEEGIVTIDGIKYYVDFISIENFDQCQFLKVIRF